MINQYYYSKLTKQEQIAYERVLFALENRITFVKIDSAGDSQSLKEIVRAVSNDHPEIFYVDLHTCSFEVSHFVTKLHIDYLYTSTVSNKIKNQIDDKVNKIINHSEITKRDADYIKIRKLYKYFITHMSYDYDALNTMHKDAYNVIGLLRDGKAVCEGISKTFKMICDRIGVECFMVFGESFFESIGQNALHSWNMVKIQGEYLHLDATWDINTTSSSGVNRYDYFCLTDDSIKSDHIFSGYPRADCREYSYFSKTKTVIKDVQYLKKYISNVIKTGKSVIYFKLDDSILRKYSIEEIDFMIKDDIIPSLSMRCGYSKSINKNQNIFFIKIKN